MASESLITKPLFTARAILVGERIDLRALEGTERLAASPATVSVKGGGIAVLFRFGAVVLFDVAPMEEVAFLEHLRPLVANAETKLETESVVVRVERGAPEGMTDANTIVLEAAGLERLQIVADALAKSIVLALYEARVARSFDHVEPLALDLQDRGSTRGHRHRLLRNVGDALLSQHRMVGRAQVSEKPDLLWEHPELERLYLRLEDDFEIRERHIALERKIDLVSRTAETILEVLQSRSSLRVEWYIVILIVVEILLTLYDLFVRR
jgi:uncharacterized Rmd1/YagE family protein